MVRLPHPGGDADVWGNLLNTFLDVEHHADGSLKIRTDGTLSQFYVKPSGGIPSSDLAAAAQAALASGNSAVQTVNSIFPSAGNVTLTASDVGAPTALAGDSDVSVAGASNGQVLTYDGPSQKWVSGTVSSTVIPDATTGNKGILQLSGDLAGNAATPTVTGTHLAAPLPVAQGGTGSTTQNFADLNTDQAVGGVKTFTSAPIVPSNSFPESAVNGLAADLAATEKTANKGAASGYAPLDSDAAVPVDNLPPTIAIVALYNNGEYPLRNTVTSNTTTQTVMWLGPSAPPIGSGYAINGLDIWDQTVS